MAILVDKRTRVITQGVGGRSGRLNTAACRHYGQGRRCFVAAVGAQDTDPWLAGMPVFGTVREARAATGATASVIYLPPPQAAAAIDEALDAELELVVCVTGGLAAPEMERVRRRLAGGRTVLLGPGCAGVLTPGEINLGTLPCEVHQRGRIGVVARSAALLCEAARRLAAYGLGQSTVVAPGADAACGLGTADALRLFDADAATDAVLLLHDGADPLDEQCARWIAAHLRKPLVALVAGPLAPRERALMERCGIQVTRDPAAMAERVAAVVEPQWLPFD